MKFVKEHRGTQIVQELNISERRVTQFTQSALLKLRQAYFAMLDTHQGNLY